MKFPNPYVNIPGAERMRLFLLFSRNRSPKPNPDDPCEYKLGVKPVEKGDPTFRIEVFQEVIKRENTTDPDNYPYGPPNYVRGRRLARIHVNGGTITAKKESDDTTPLIEIEFEPQLSDAEFQRQWDK